MTRKSASFMAEYIYKGDGWIAETDNGSVVLFHWDAPDVDELRAKIGQKVWIGDVWGVLESVTYVKGYFGRYSANGYLDCTPWEFDTNKRRLARTLRDLYGDEDSDDD